MNALPYGIGIPCCSNFFELRGTLYPSSRRPLVPHWTLHAASAKSDRCSRLNPIACVDGQAINLARLGLSLCYGTPNAA